MLNNFKTHWSEIAQEKGTSQAVTNNMSYYHF